jgi:UDP-N-acetylmuramoyl-tripeptide--D-alanyl-D-alanine ligase
MKTFLQNILQKLLRLESSLILKRQKPKIIGIAGSVGKTSVKEAAACVLRSRFRIRKTIGNYNNEIGVPLTIIGEKTAGRNVFGWIKILFKGFLLSVLRLKNFPEVLILELGVDKPGDMGYLVSFLKPNVACVTAISEIPAHLEFFKDVEELAAEEIKLIKSLSKEGTAVLNFDDRRVRKAKIQTNAEVLTFGFDSRADVKADSLVFSSKTCLLAGKERDHKKICGASYKLHYLENIVPVRMPEIFGKQQVYASLAAASMGIAFGMNLVEISQNLKDFKSPPGRMNLIPGIKHSYIIDDSYNASPDATLAALEILGELSPSGKKIAILGDMLELGPKTEEGHRKVGKKAAEVCDVLVSLGAASKFMIDEAKKQGMDSSKIFEFEEGEAINAAKFVQNKILKQGDLILIKGSQRMRLEKAVKELMAEPEKAEELLVRQEWSGNDNSKKHLNI